jgi:hypothetical protein
MNISVPVPDDIAARFGGEDALGPIVLEAFAVQEYLAGRLTVSELRAMLGLETDTAYWAFAERLGLTHSRPRSVREKAAIMEQFRAFRDTHRLGGLKPAELIREGRR